MFITCKLYPRVSKYGRPYFVGRMGGVKILILENSRGEPGDTATHVMMFAEAAPYDANRRHAEPTAPAEPSNTAPASARPDGNRPKLDDEVPSLVDDPLPF